MKIYFCRGEENGERYGGEKNVFLRRRRRTEKEKEENIRRRKKLPERDNKQTNDQTRKDRATQPIDLGRLR